MDCLHSMPRRSSEEQRSMAKSQKTNKPKIYNSEIYNKNPNSPFPFFNSQLKKTVFSCFLLNIGVYLQCEKGEGTVSPLIFVKDKSERKQI